MEPEEHDDPRKSPGGDEDQAAPVRSKRRRANRPSVGEDLAPQREVTTSSGYTTGQLLVVLIVGLGLGAFVGYSVRGGARAPKAEPIAAESDGPQLGPLASAVGPVAPAAAPGADKFGRQPGDEHFGHDHPPEGAAAPAAPAAPAGTGPDSFGRAPGSEHYGHTHE